MTVVVHVVYVPMVTNSPALTVTFSASPSLYVQEKDEGAGPITDAVKVMVSPTRVSIVPDGLNGFISETHMDVSVVHQWGRVVGLLGEEGEEGVSGKWTR